MNNGQTILAVAGGAGGTSSASDAGGGGGGSGAVNCGAPANCATGVILIVAAGGNGGESQGNGNGGLALNGAPGAGGSGGGGNGGGGGGGMLTAGLPGGGSGFGTGGSQVISSGLVPGGLGSDGGTNDGGEGMGGGGGGGTGNNSGSGGGAGRAGAAGGNSNAATSYVHPSGTNLQDADGLPGVGPSSGSVTVTCLGSLPIQLINFKAVINDDNVHLIWSTASEKDNHGFDIERSADNRNWTTLGFMPGNGTTAEKSEYKFTDESPLAGVNYYRLKQMDTDGSFQHTPMVVADVRANTLQFDVFPNPSVNGELNVRTVSQEEGDALLEIYNWAGYKVYKESIHLLKGTMVYPVSLATYPKGAYTARLEMPDGTVQFKKILLQ
ncbi:MAG TPA: T9SS type A sorting domain-containing protein [Saprospiraceae bacterium]|nr:T9SS type A sorting domain-containing protein [Saprospiraceae bacterium]